jgi:hypothetical protein
MRIMKTLVGDPRIGDPQPVDTVEYEGRPWLVAGGFIPSTEEGFLRPARLIRPVGAQFGAGGQSRGRWADYVLPLGISPAIIDGSEPPPPQEFEVVDLPELSLRILTSALRRTLPRERPAGP